MSRVRDLLVDLRGFVVRAQPGSSAERVGLFHQTFVEYVLDSAGREFGIEPEEAHRALATAIGEHTPGFTHEKPRAERDGRPQNRASSPALRGAPVSEPERVFAKRAELLKRSHA